MRLLVWLATLLSVVLVALSWFIGGALGRATAGVGIACAALVIIAFVRFYAGLLVGKFRRGGDQR